MTTVRCPARPMKVFSAAKGVVEGSADVYIVIAFGETFGQAEFVAVSEQDARRLGWFLGQALGDPAPSTTGRSIDHAILAALETSRSGKARH